MRRVYGIVEVDLVLYYFVGGIALWSFILLLPCAVEIGIGLSCHGFYYGYGGLCVASYLRGDVGNGGFYRGLGVELIAFLVSGDGGGLLTVVGWWGGRLGHCKTTSLWRFGCLCLHVGVIVFGSLILCCLNLCGHCLLGLCQELISVVVGILCTYEGESVCVGSLNEIAVLVTEYNKSIGCKCSLLVHTDITADNIHWRSCLVLNLKDDRRILAVELSGKGYLLHSLVDLLFYSLPGSVYKAIFFCLCVAQLAECTDNIF